MYWAAFCIMTNFSSPRLILTMTKNSTIMKNKASADI